MRHPVALMQINVIALAATIMGTLQQGGASAYSRGDPPQHRQALGRNPV
jgi:hypothetical protein